MEKKKLIDRFADSPLWFHFIVYTLFGAVFTFLVFKFFLMGANVKEAPQEIILVQKIMSLFIGAVVGLIGVAADYNGKKNDRYFTKMTEFRDKAKSLTTAIELHTLKNDLILYWQKSSCGHPHARSVARDIEIIIETRMEFEFKIPQS